MEHVARVTREDDTWWVQLPKNRTFAKYDSFDALPNVVKDKLALLTVAPVGFRDENIGRRVSTTSFWVFY